MVDHFVFPARTIRLFPDDSLSKTIFANAHTYKSKAALLPTRTTALAMDASIAYLLDNFSKASVTG